MARALRTGLLRRLLLLALLAPAVVVGPDRPAAAAPGEPVPEPRVTALRVTPPPTPLGALAAHAFSVRGTAGAGADVDVTGQVELRIVPDGSCDGLTCTPESPGSHTAWASLRGDPDVVGSAEFDVVGVDRVALDPAERTVAAGEPTRYTARGLHLTGDEIGDRTTVDVGDVTARTELTMSRPGACDDNAHTCGSAHPGRYVVRGRLTGGDAEDGEAVLTVGPPRLDRIDLFPPTATIVAGATQPYRADGFDRFDEPLGEVTGRTVLDIDGGGRCDRDGCTAERAGTYTVTGTGAGVRRPGRARLTVVAGPVDDVVLEPRSPRIVAGAEQPYRVVARDVYGNRVGDVTDRAVLTIPEPGRCDLDTCTAATPGRYRVTARVVLGEQPELVAGAALTVVADRLDRLRLEAESDQVVAGALRTYTALGFDRLGNPLGDVTDRTTFSIGPSGRCAGAGCGADRAGSYAVTGRYAGTGATGRATLHVRAAPLARLVIDPRGGTVAAGVGTSFVARGLDAFGNDAGDVTGDSVFDIDRGGSCARAVCSADEPGDHTVTATRTGTTVRGRAVLHVRVGSLARVVLEPATASATVGAAVPYQVRGFDAAGNPRGDATRRTVLRLRPEGSCTGGTCTATRPGRHTVVAEVAGTGMRPTAVLDVRRQQPAALRLHPSAATIAVGATQPYRVEGLTADGAGLGDVTGSARVTIDAGGSCGRAGCGARRPRTYRVHAELPGTLATGAAVLTVEAGEPATLELEPAAATVTAGSAQAFRALAYDRLGNFLGDVTGQTEFVVRPSGTCDGPTCTVDAAGRHSVTARTVVGSARGVAELTVVPERTPPSTGRTPDPPEDAAGIVPQPAAGRVAAGARFTFAVRARDAAGRDLGDLTAEAAMTMDPDGTCDGGRCTAATAGTHRVRITARGLRAEATLEVVAAGEVAQVLLDPQVSSVRTGAAQQYRAWGFDAYGNELGDVTDRTTISVEGVGPCAAGSCTVGRAGGYAVRGTVGGTRAADTARLEVVPVPAAELALNPTAGSVRAGEPLPFRVRGYDELGNDLGDLTATTRFSIRPAGSCSAAGCTADRAGGYTVTGTAAAGVAGSALTADAALQVLPPGPAPLPVPAWLIGVVAAAVAVAAGTVLAWAYPGSGGPPAQQDARDRRTDRDDRHGRVTDLTVRPSPGTPGTRLRERRRLHPDLTIRVEPHADPVGEQTLREESE